MNEVSKPFLEQICNGTFKEIHKYRSSWKDHIHHVRVVLEELSKQRLFVKKIQVHIRPDLG